MDLPPKEDREITPKKYLGSKFTLLDPHDYSNIKNLFQNQSYTINAMIESFNPTRLVLSYIGDNLKKIPALLAF